MTFVDYYDPKGSLPSTSAALSVLAQSITLMIIFLITCFVYEMSEYSDKSLLQFPKAQGQIASFNRPMVQNQKIFSSASYMTKKSIKSSQWEAVWQNVWHFCLKNDWND